MEVRDRGFLRCNVGVACTSQRWEAVLLPTRPVYSGGRVPRKCRVRMLCPAEPSSPRPPPDKVLSFAKDPFSSYSGRLYDICQRTRLRTPIEQPRRQAYSPLIANHWHTPETPEDPPTGRDSCPPNGAPTVPLDACVGSRPRGPPWLHYFELEPCPTSQTSSLGISRRGNWGL